nr:alpha/beta hydrolase [Halococcus sediminicola]
MKRRQFITRAGSTAFGIATVGATANTVTASRTVPLVSTREHFTDGGDLAAGRTATGYDTNGNVPGIDTACADDLTVFVHGWNKNGDDPEAEALAKFHEADTALGEAGYTGTLVGYTWDSDKGGGVDFGWGEAQAVAQSNGPKLANFVLDYARNCSGTLRFISHSLGAQVVFSALRTLNADSTWDANGYKLASVHLLGAAQDNEAPTTEWRDTYEALLYETELTFNYYSQEDDVLAWVYNTIEFDQALGETGAESGNTTPGNYSDYDATSQVGSNHSGYVSSLADEVVSDMASS